MNSKFDKDTTNIILSRYSDRENIMVNKKSVNTIYDSYLSKVISVSDLSNKSILEIGAGCSQYGSLFLDNGCSVYFANDLIPERLAVSRISDSRYIEIPGDFRYIDVPEKVDIIFSSLTMMFVVPMIDQFIDKIHKTLKPGGIFLSMDPNYLCPLSIYRRFSDRKPNPARLFNPHSYAKAFVDHGFEIEALEPFTAPYPFVTGNWLLGTNFWLKVRKK